MSSHVYIQIKMSLIVRLYSKLKIIKFQYTICIAALL